MSSNKKVNIQMTIAEREALLQLLERFGQDLSCAGCNDWKCPASWPEEVKLKFNKNCQHDEMLEVTSDEWLQDTQVLSHLTSVIRKED